MTAYIPKDFAPSEDTFTALQKNGITQEFLHQCVTTHFIEFWNELKTDKKAKGKKSAWQTTYRVWARRAFQGKIGREYEEKMHWRNGYGKSKPNLVQEVAAGLMAQDMAKPQKKSKPNYRLPDPPADTGERMSQEQAFEQLNKILPGSSS